MATANARTTQAQVNILPDIIFIMILTILLLTGHSMAYGRPSSGAVSAGEFRLHTAQGTDAALLQRTRVDIQVNGILARVVVEQVFHNPSTEWVEGEYVFPLSTTSAVDYMAMTIGNRRIVGEIKEKQEAKKIYQQAKKEGKKASLISQQRPNLFTNRVANIAPGETITVELHYIDTAHYDKGRFSLRIPTTLTPRYDPAPGPTTASEGIHPPMTLSDNAAVLELKASINTGLPLASLRSLYHPADQHWEQSRQILQLRPGAKMNRDVVVEWEPATGAALKAAAFRETIGSDNYLLLMLLPPQQFVLNSALPRETIFVIDTSGSMSGVSIVQAQQALLAGLSQLQQSDRFNVIQFNSNTSSLWPQAVEASSDNIAIASQYIKTLRANGGTEMAGALRTAFSGAAPPNYIRQVIFITDGSVGNEDALFELIHRERGNSRLFTVGIGSAPNSHFMEKAATMGRGVFTYIGAQEDIQDRMTDLFYKIQYPLLTNIVADFGQSSALEVFPHKSPDLYAGEPLILTAKISGQSLPGYVWITGQRQQEIFQQQLDINYLPNTPDIGKVWARHKLRALYDVENQARHNGDADMVAAFQEEITHLALTHKLISKHTSFVAVEQVVSRSFNELLANMAVSNAMPLGNTMAVPIPRGGLGIQQLWLTALLSLLALLFLNKPLVNKLRKKYL